MILDLCLFFDSKVLHTCHEADSHCYNKEEVDG